MSRSLRSVYDTLYPGSTFGNDIDPKKNTLDNSPIIFSLVSSTNTRAFSRRRIFLEMKNDRSSCRPGEEETKPKFSRQQLRRRRRRRRVKIGIIKPRTTKRTKYRWILKTQSRADFEHARKGASPALPLSKRRCVRLQLDGGNSAQLGDKGSTRLVEFRQRNLDGRKGKSRRSGKSRRARQQHSADSLFVSHSNHYLLSAGESNVSQLHGLTSVASHH